MWPITDSVYMLHSGQQYVNDLNDGMHAKLLCMLRENQVLLQGIC